MQKTKINLLFLDDEEDILESMSKRLRVRGFNVIAVTSGKSAIEAARNNPVDIALLDVGMPGISGEDAFTVLKKEHKWIEAVMLTGHKSFDNDKESLGNRPFVYLHKPCELEQILEALNNAYQQSVLNRKEMEK